MQILNGNCIDWRERRLVSKLYMGQSAEVNLDQWETSCVKNGTGVRQECFLSPILFKLYSEYLSKDDLEGSETSK
jgi:hypothetical protein